MTDLDQAVSNSKERTVVLFKHSTRCSVSSMARRIFENEWVEKPEAEAWFLDLIRYREISNEIAQRFSVRHESPQMIVLRDTRPVHHASHSRISAVHTSI